MRNPERVLKSLAEHSNTLNYKYKRLYRILFNTEMFYVAYQNIYAKVGNMTAGDWRENGRPDEHTSYWGTDSLIKRWDISATSG